MPRTINRRSQHSSATPMHLTSTASKTDATTATRSQDHLRRLIQGAILVGLGVGAIAIPVVTDSLTPRVLRVDADDFSGSGYQPAVYQALCETRAEQAKSVSQKIAIAFAATAEVTQDGQAGSTLGIQKCEAPSVPSSLKNKPGTDPNTMLEAVVDVVASARSKGNQDSVVVTAWLQAAEAVNGKTLDLTKLKQQIDTITADRGVVAFIGPSGRLQADLLATFKGHPRVQVCPTQSLKDCVGWAYQTGRQLPKASQVSNRPRV